MEMHAAGRHEDVVASVMRAVHDGVITHGEEFEEAVLAGWMNVPTSTAHDAITYLVSTGVVSRVSAGRVRLAAPTRSDFDNALQLLFGHAELAARWSVPHFTDTDVASLHALVEELHDEFRKESRRSDDLIARLVQFLAARSGNPLFADIVTIAINRTSFLLLSYQDMIFWDSANFLDPFMAAAEARDAEACAGVIRVLYRSMTDHLQRARERAEQPESRA